MSNVTIIGLGQMGTAIAKLLIDAGTTITVWNRSAEKANLLATYGAQVAHSAAGAVSASPDVHLV